MSSSFATKEADSDEDPVVLMLKKTGCIELHYKVQVTPKVNTIEVENSLNFVSPPRSASQRLKIGGSAKRL